LRFNLNLVVLYDDTLHAFQIVAARGEEGGKLGVFEAVLGQGELSDALGQDFECCHE